MKIQDFDFSLPSELIAQIPIERRASSRLLHLDGKTGVLRDLMFVDLTRHLRAGDVVVLNDTYVIKARLFGIKNTGGEIEVMVERVLSEHCVLAMIRASHAPKINAKFVIAGQILVTVLHRDHNLYTLHFDHEKTVSELLDLYGSLPLPPYILRAATSIDETRYQTVYAKERGAVAAPTAGLHFDQAMLTSLQEMGVIVTYVTLHVGAGTFQPVYVENIIDHKMHKEFFHVPEEAVKAIRYAKINKRKVLAVGTTSLRALEAATVAGNGELKSGHGETDIYITPGYRFCVVDCLLTNFHLPCSTLLILVSAFGGLENIHRSYRHAINERYRFFSYGDAMLIER
ncbi:MAG: tRNA preQ1(34) S-adenosylmethionine ribosyltransferase-isomerase QueA [Nitrosomonadaceae bacterium]|nr:tRNA preQ1(34) S-adenosylmethionine ribosyltransferase-isomerase QueA [Nitrosomonadaceae bacterium]